MARSTEDIEQSMIATIESIDPSIDVRKGPIFDLFIKPTAAELSFAEERAEHLARLYSLQFANEATDAEVGALATDYGTGRADGGFSSTRQTFFSFTRPDGLINIETGSLISTNDNSIVFRVIEDAQIDGSIADAYFNAGKRRYEITTKVEAVAIGEDYNVAAFRLTKLLTPIEGIDGTENPVGAEGGSPQETITDLVARLKERTLGFERGTNGGILTHVLNQDPINIKALTLLKSNNHEIFERRDEIGPAIDIYVIGSIFGVEGMTFVATGGETEIILDAQPVLSVDNVTVNGLAVSYTFIEDDTSSSRGSILANDKIDLEVALGFADVVLIAYITNELIGNLQLTFGETDGSESSLFNTSTLIRTPVRVGLDIQVEITILASFSESRVVEEVETEIRSYCEPDAFPELLLPEVLRQNLINNVAGVSSNVKITLFTKTIDGRQDVEVIDLNQHEQPFISNADIIVVAT